MEEALCFDDVLLVPNFSFIRSRREPSLATRLGRNGRFIDLQFPVIPSNMATISEYKMCNAIGAYGGLGILHRFMDIDATLREFKLCTHRTGVSFGVGDIEKDRVDALVKAGATIFCFDIANAASVQGTEMCNWFRQKYPDLFLIAGTFGSRHSLEEFEKYTNQAVDLFRLNCGSGAICSTRLKTGFGYPQFSLTWKCASHYPVISDGGCQTPGDIAKCFAVGAQAVMIGYMVAGTDECPGELFMLDNKYYKRYNGSASGRYAEGSRTSEGVKGCVEARGPIKPILADIEGGLRSALSYGNAINLAEFRRNVGFIKVSNSSQTESGIRVKVLGE